MRIRLKFVALESDHLPSEGTDELDLEDGANLVDALSALGLKEDNPYLTLVNEASIPASERASTRLEEGDLLTLFSPIKGG